MGRGSLRSGVVLALGLVLLVQVLTLLQGVRSARRLQARVTAQTEERLAAARPRLDEAFALPGRAAWDRGAALAVALGVASEVEVLDVDGSSIYARPTASPVSHVLRPEQRREIASGSVLTVAVQGGSVVRSLSYLPLPTQPGFLRLASRAGDLEDDLNERQQVFMAHVVSLGVLAAALLFVARRDSAAASQAPAKALDLYEQAMERLRDHGEQVEARHEVERRRMQEALREQETMARAGELTAGIVHEVRNGLGTIVGYVRLLQREEPGGDKAAAARAIGEECATLEAIVRRFAEFVRLQELHLATFDLQKLLSRVAGRELRGDGGVEFRFDGLDEQRQALGDEGLLERAVENVLRNAVSAASDGGGHVAVVVRRVAGDLELVVDDDGPGLPEGHDGEIRPFQSTRPGGLGLGLPFARKILLLHGGSLDLGPRPGGGARVTLRWPQAAVAMPDGR